MLRFETLEIHRVFLRISNLALSQNLSPKALADTIRASFGIVGFIIATIHAKVKGRFVLFRLLNAAGRYAMMEKKRRCGDEAIWAAERTAKGDFDRHLRDGAGVLRALSRDAGAGGLRLSRCDPDPGADGRGHGVFRQGARRGGQLYRGRGRCGDVSGRWCSVWTVHRARGRERHPGGIFAVL